MKPHLKTTRPEVSRRKKSSLKREFDYCKKAKGAHRYELTIPGWLKSLAFLRGDTIGTVAEFYAEHDKPQKYERPRFRYWVCTACGHLNFDSEEHPSKKIRQNLALSKA